MTWQDRLRDAAYRSPDGNRIEFAFEDVSRSVSKKTTAFDFPDANGTLVQDLGRKGRRYPLRVFFSGDNHDLAADAFEIILLEKGTGVLEHPRYGQIDVVPFDEISQRDDLKTQANQTVIEVTFLATITTVYPTGESDAAAEAAAALEAYNAAAAAELEERLRLESTLEEVTFRDQYHSFLDSVEDSLGELAGAQDDIAKRFKDISDSINRGLDVLIGDPLTLAFQTKILIGAPSRSAGLIKDKLDAYGDLAQDITSSSSNRISTSAPEDRPPQMIDPTGDNRAANELASRQVFAQGAVSGSAEALLVTDYETQQEALLAVEQTLEQLDVITDWADDNYRELGEVDTGAAYEQLVKTISLATGAVVAASFNLRREKRITIDRDRSIIDFSGEFFGEVDVRLDQLINTNALTGSQILELPKGLELVIYE